MKSRYIIIILVAFMSVGVSKADNTECPTRLVNAIDSLDRILELNPNFAQLRIDSVNSLKDLALMSNIDASVYKSVGDLYNGLNTDSALLYYRKGALLAQAEDDSFLFNSMTIDYAQQLSKIALFEAALKILDNVGIESVDSLLKIKYYSVKSQIYLDILEHASSTQHHRDILHSAVETLDTLNNYFPNNSVPYRMAEAQILYLSGKTTMALGELNEVFDKIEPDTPFYAVAAAMLAKYYKGDKEKVNEYLYYLTLSAISDISNNNGEAVSLAVLGGEMLKQNDVDRAYKYLTVAGLAIENSRSNNFVDIVYPSLISLSSELYKKHSAKKTDLRVVEIFLLIIICGLGFWLWRVRRSIKKDAVDNDRLKATVLSRDAYINQLLNLCSTYIDGLEDYNRLVVRKLVASQAQDLYNMAESGKILQDYTEHFFEVFDSSVLKLFPTFIDDLNSLLLPDKQACFPLKGKLSPELRIVALMRLGVTDSARQSKFLGLSLNTVYTYRNRIKSRAVEREKFDENIKNLSK